jgi:hypothetical protein
MAAIHGPSDGEALYDLGYALYERRIFEGAAAVLARARAFFPGEEALVTEHVAALDEDGRNAEACEVLRSEGALLTESFICRYLLAFNLVMSGDLKGAGTAAADLAPRDADESFMARRIHEMLARGATAGPVSRLDGMDLRGWHFVTTGSLLLHLSPYGFDDGMRGRYAYTEDSEDRCRHGVERACLALAELERRPTRIMGASDRDSQIFSTATGLALGLPVEPIDERPGLVVVYDLANVPLEELKLLATRREGQLVFAQAACWTEPPGFVPDLVTYLYQVNHAPWEERSRLGEREARPASTEPAGVIAQRIHASTGKESDLAPGDSDAGLTSFCAAVAGAFGKGSNGERRVPLWGGGGPVKSSRFL